MTSTTTVIVDDADPGITYKGLWNEVDPQTLDPDYGISQSVGGTLHNTTAWTISDGNNSTPSLGFDYKFTGLMISVFALMKPEDVNNATVPYQWTCYLNGIPTPPVVLAKLTEPSTIRICFEDALEDDEYVLDFGFTQMRSASARTQVLFDYLEYRPSGSAVSLTYDFIGVGPNNPGIIYGNSN
ncbi:hypothetical protein HYPSUDRAFT_58373 [Hypholoma sublateritium FD-334 SS-4]|uniref:Uncharacterized protein n=1 Tax=Hypholoma sublateritium (strain FD-334 SS-4) TaxID=945553 RepID=A0A0D2NAQ0_HYPSF|nr:hypothetical protein HYPSUDRAFT_58373 [Hypholoma sublateritium FD-334 SS-4]